MAEFVPGMRVVVVDSPEWEQDWDMAAERIPGHYGKVVALLPDPRDDDTATVGIEITGHVDGGVPEEHITDLQWFFPEELTVVD